MMKDDLTSLLKSHKHRPLASPRPFLTAYGLVIHTNFCVDCNLVYWTWAKNQKPLDEGVPIQDAYLKEHPLTKF